MDLRDYFAAHVAAALAHRMERPEGIAARAYDLADALVRERVRRPTDRLGWAEELPPEAYLDADDARGFVHTGLLDEPAPLSERDEDLLPFERDGSPEWEVDAKPILDVRPSERPGLRRTAPAAEPVNERKKSG